MKINVTVDLDDFFSEDESSFNEQILSHLEWEIKSKIWNEFKEKALDSFKNKIDYELEKGKEVELERIITKVFTDKKIKIKEASKNNPQPEMVTLFEYIEDKITNSYFSEGRSASSILDSKLREKEVQFEKMLSNSSEEIITKLKDRYDLLFASQIVNSLNKNGMLKEDVSKILLSE